LLDAVFDRARQHGLIGQEVTASCDSSGMESRHVSRHFLRRTGRMKRYRRWPKLTIVCDNASHLVASLVVSLGPKNDCPDFLPAVRQACGRMPIGRLLADGAYDCEAHHRCCRQELGIAETLIPINPRGHPDTVPKTPYRRAMKEQLPSALYGQRWQVESVFSRLKRRLGSALTARSDVARERECFLAIATYNLMIT
jgi:hypothetical protein